jgi:glucokinase
MLDPDAVVLGGGLGLATGLYRDRLIASTRAHIWAEACRHLPIVPAALGADAGLVGSALAAARRP